MFSVGVGYNEHPQLAAQAQHDESLFHFRMIRISNEYGTWIIKDSSRLNERNSVVPLVRDILVFIPLETHISYRQYSQPASTNQAALR